MLGKEQLGAPASAPAESATPIGGGAEHSRALGRWIAVATSVAGVVLTVAWVLGSPEFVRVVHASPLPQPWTLVLLTTQALLVATVAARKPRWVGWVWNAVAVAALVLTLLRIVHHMDGAGSVPFDFWPFAQAPLASELHEPSLASCIVVLFLGVSTILAHRGELRGSLAFSLLGALPPIFSMEAYLLGDLSSLRMASVSQMSFGPAVLAQALSAALALNSGYVIPIAKSLFGRSPDPGRRVSLGGPVALALGVAVVAGVVSIRLGVDGVTVLVVGWTVTGLLIVSLLGYHFLTLGHSDLLRQGAENALHDVSRRLASREELAKQLDASIREFREVIETSPDAFVTVDPRGKIVAWNPAAERIFGWTFDEVRGKPLHRLLVPDFPSWVTKGGDFHARMEIDDSRLGDNMDVETVRKDGTRLWVDLTLWRSSTGDEGYYHAFARDITAKRMAEERLLEANSDLREFAAITAHDLRNPLVAVRLAAEMLAETTADGTIDEQGREWITRIHSAVMRGQALISDLLEYSSITSGARENVRVDLADLVKEVADEVAAEAGREISFHIGSLPTIEGDLPRLRQLFINLFSNAGKYVPRDRLARVEVSASSGRRLVRLTISDNGEGVPDADKGSIFGAFQRGSANGDVPGTGIGLAICRKVVERHGGTIRVEDAPSGGAAFVIELPRWAGSMTSGLGDEMPASLASGHGL